MLQRTVVEESPKNIAVMDVFSKLVQNRIVFIDGIIDDELANGVIAQLLYLNAIDPKSLIHVYINSPGGSVNQGFAIYDIAKIISAPIRTICIGEAASMGAFLMFIGKERCALKHSRFMLHEVSSWNHGTLSNMKISLKETEIIQESIFEVLRKKLSIENIDDVLQKDFWMGAKDAFSYGLVTEIIDYED